MQSHRNPTRRNRNIGTAKQGHGEANQLVIPDQLNRPYWLSRVGDCRVEEHTIGGWMIRFVIEANALGCVHPSTVPDVLRVLEALPQSDWAGLRTIVFRQPTRKQLILRPAWGRLLYDTTVAKANGETLAVGPVICLDAVQVDKVMVWSTSLDPDLSQELERLRSDGHDVQRSGRKFSISINAASARNTQLYRTLLHEIGHWFDWLSKVEEPSAKGGDRDALERAYFARPKSEREAFAHRYADTQRAILETRGIIPFDQS
ncbi:hypothetical protein [Novosphingobium ginsenosidimutans]|uniref:Uncharacterized protein n=1 Tax=Novosphingobium ginsenosidimutans TaxID=1176536 RepID=A0A5B8S7K7_9SPHN|nr:hypothetical protein [Novosphingobium ginsenosidimutans]QEA16445.1 hypothetical protein FRF71_10050 [Novosphingobium ginsenosidimutans]